MTKKSEFDQLNDLDEVIAENNRLIVSAGGPQKDSKSEVKELNRKIHEIKQQSLVDTRVESKLNINYTAKK
jgi:hypothetical protein